jgi:hypothetical protein
MSTPRRFAGLFFTGALMLTALAVPRHGWAQG